MNGKNMNKQDLWAYFKVKGENNENSEGSAPTLASILKLISTDEMAMDETEVNIWHEINRLSEGIEKKVKKYASLIWVYGLMVSTFVFHHGNLGVNHSQGGDI